MILFLFQFISYSDQLSQFILHNITSCPESDKIPMSFNGSIIKVGFNKFGINGEVVVRELLKPPLEVIFFNKKILCMKNKCFK